MYNIKATLPATGFSQDFPEGQKVKREKYGRYNKTQKWGVGDIYNGREVKIFKIGILPTSNEPLVLKWSDEYDQYSEDIETLKTLISELTVSVYYVREDKREDTPEWSYNVFNVTIERKGRKISFEYGSSVYDSYANVCIGLYDVLCAVKSEFYCPIGFKNFCAEYGYSTDSMKAKDVYERCLEQAALLREIFTESEMDCMPS